MINKRNLFYNYEGGAGFIGLLKLTKANWAKPAPLVWKFMHLLLYTQAAVNGLFD
jgi:hypothetical protein